MRAGFRSRNDARLTGGQSPAVQFVRGDYIQTQYGPMTALRTDQASTIETLMLEVNESAMRLIAHRGGHT